MRKINPYILVFLIYGFAIGVLCCPMFANAGSYEVNGIWDHPTKKGKWLVEIENNGKVIKFEIDDLTDKNEAERKTTIQWMVNKTLEKTETK